MRYKLFIIYIFVLNWSNVFSQETDNVLNRKGINIKISKKDKGNAPLLVSKLTKDCGSEQEKFDAIFLWVTKNISYSENAFYTPINSGPKDIEKILTTRKTICLGYAQLMDTLCKLANITNVTVFGYAKDEFYDVNDSIYGHNHAWNAVKLGGLWYVYDATWSDGVIDYKLTKIALFIENLLKKFPEKYKKKKVRIPRKFRKRSMCDVSKIERIYYYKHRYFNRLIRLRLMLFPIKAVKKYDKGISTDFYLSNPRMFAATHIPDDPIWSLLDRKKCSEYEKDSLFYYINDSVYKKQERQGVECLECDTYYESSIQNKFKILNDNSLIFNFNNRFISSYCNEELGRILFNKSLISNTERVAIADSSAIFFKNAVEQIGVSRKNIAKYFKYEKTKNDIKAKLLLNDNVSHAKFIKNKVKITIEQTKKFQEISNKSSAFATNYYNTIRRFNRFKTDYNFDKITPYSDKKIKELEEIHNRKSQKLDSLILKINQQKISFDSINLHLSLNIWPQVFKHDAILMPFKKCISARRLFKDNYKKVIVDLRKSIYPMEYKYTYEIDHILYIPSAECLTLFNSITYAIKLKQVLCNDLLKSKLELLKTKAISINEINDFRTFAVNETQQDFCWLSSIYPKIMITLNGLYTLKEKQSYVLRIISLENETERKRQSIINKAIKNGYRASNTFVANDAKQMNKKYKEITKYVTEIKDTVNFNEKRYNKIVDRLNRILERK